MVGLTNYTANELLSAITSKANFTNIATAYLGLFSAVGSDVGTGFTEAAYAGYARQATPGVTWNAPSGTSPSSITNAGSIAFPACTNTGTAVVETEIAFGLFDAVTGGNLTTWDWLGGDDWQPFNCTLASPGVFTVDGKVYVNGDIVTVTAEFGGTLNTGLAVNNTYTVAGVSGNTFNVGANTSSIGNGMVRKVSPQPVVANLQPIINAGSVVIKAA